MEDGVFNALGAGVGGAGFFKRRGGREGERGEGNKYVHENNKLLKREKF